MKLPKFAEYRKWVVAAVGIVAQVVAAGVLSGAALHWAQLVLAAAALVGVQQVRQVPQAPQVPQTPKPTPPLPEPGPGPTVADHDPTATP